MLLQGLFLCIIAVVRSQSATPNCEPISGLHGVCNVPNGTLQFSSMAAQCLKVDAGNGSIPLSASAQKCYAGSSVACQAAVAKLACATFCQSCNNANTIVVNNFCNSLCQPVISSCTAECVPMFVGSLGGTCVDPSATVCLTAVDGSTPMPTSTRTTLATTLATTSATTSVLGNATLVAPIKTDPPSLAALLPGLLIGLGLGLPLAAIVALFVILRGRERIEPHSEEDAGPSHWLGTSVPTSESVAAAEAALALGREKAGDEQTSTLDLESEDEVKPATKKADAKKADAKKSNAKKGDAKKEEDAEYEYEYEYVTETETEEPAKESKKDSKKDAAKKGDKDEKYHHHKKSSKHDNDDDDDDDAGDKKTKSKSSDKKPKKTKK